MKLKRCYNRYIRVFAEVMSLMISTLSSRYKRVGLLGRPTHASPSREHSPHRSGPPIDSHRRRRWKKEEDPHLHTNEAKTIKAKA
jgi:hypothetical protein